MLDSVYHLGRLHFPHLLALGGIEDPRWKWATDKVAELQADNERLKGELAKVQEEESRLVAANEMLRKTIEQATLSGKVPRIAPYPPK